MSIFEDEEVLKLYAYERETENPNDPSIREDPRNREKFHALVRAANRGALTPYDTRVVKKYRNASTGIRKMKVWEKTTANGTYRKQYQPNKDA